MNEREYVETLTREMLVAWMRCSKTAGNPPVKGIVEIAREAWAEIERLVPRGPVRLPEVPT